MANSSNAVVGAFQRNRFLTIVKANLTRGNMIQIAIAFILGTAFNAIVTSLAQDIIVQAIYLAVPALKDLANQNNPGINYPKFIALVIVFIVDVIFLSVLMYAVAIIMDIMNRKKPKPIPPPPMANNNDILAELKQLNTHFATAAIHHPERKTSTKRQE